jgi:hypothetical protein
MKLTAKTAREARSEIIRLGLNRTKDVIYMGYSPDGECVLISSVRKVGVKANVATIKRNRSPRPVRFEIVEERGEVG